MIKEPIDLSLSSISQINTNQIGILNVPDTELQSQINLFYVMLNTQNGEKIMDYEFGVPFTSKMFDQYNSSNEDLFEIELSQLLSEKTAKYFPNFSLLNLESYYEGLTNEENQILIIKCLWAYLDKFKFNSISIISINNKMGSLISPIENFDGEKTNASDILSSKMIVNIINTIQQQFIE